ncbi:MAG TPA: DMT family transporter [Candidatus Limnocylindrales bacterium]|nr:DMT family transporter [Candidatus Limnocylindrales bacterium]
MIARPTRSDLLLLLALGLMWGTSYAFIKLGVDNGLPTFTLIATRLAIGLALLATVVVMTKTPLPRDPRTYGHLFVMAVINVVIPFTLITTAERSVDSAIAAILNGAMPLIVIVLAAIVFHDEPITLNRLVGVIVGYVGVIVLVAPGLTSGSAAGSAVSGELALIGSTISYAIGAVYSRRMLRSRGLRPVVPAAFQVAFALVMVSILAFAFEQPLGVNWNGSAILAVVWLGLLGSGLAYLVQFRLLSRIGATGTAQLSYLLPVVGIVSGALMLGEQIDAIVIAGTALVLGGVALVNSRYGTRRIWGRQLSPAEAVPKP